MISLINGEKVYSFSGLNSALRLTPGIQTIKFISDDSGVFEILMAMFDSSEIAGPQNIELEVIFPKKGRKKYDYEIGFHLNDKWYQLGYGLFNEFVQELNKRAKAQAMDRRTIVLPTSICANTVVS